MNTDQYKERISRRGAEAQSFFSAPLRLCVSSCIMYFIRDKIVFGPEH
jgi:hypothetical protein